jgi:hypothetical protein
VNRQPLLDLHDQGTGNSSTPIVRVDRQAVNVATPTVEGADDRADDRTTDFGQKDMSRACSDGSA